MATEQLRYKITADTSGFTNGLNKVSSKLQSFGKSLIRNITLPLAAAATASVKFASDLEEAMTKADAVFGDSSKEMKKWASTAATSFGTSKTDALEFSSTIASIAQALSFSSTEAKNFGKSITELSADYASFYNTSTEIARTGLSSIFTGETKPLKKFGIVMTEVNLEQFALQQGITKSIKKMTQAEKVQLRYNYVLANSKNVIGDYQRTSSGLANTVRTTVASFTDLAAAIGTYLLPLAKKLVLKVTDLIGWWKELDGSTKNLYASLAILAAAIGPIITALGLLLTPIGLIIASIAGITWAVIEFWGVISPVIVRVVNYFVDLYNNVLPLRVLIGFVWQAFKTFFDGIILGFTTAMDFLKNFATAFKKLLKGDFKGATAAITEAFTGSLPKWAEFGKKAGADFSDALNKSIKDRLKPITEEGLNLVISDIKTLVENEVKRILAFLGIDFTKPAGGGGGGGGGGGKGNAEIIKEANATAVTLDGIFASLADSISQAFSGNITGKGLLASLLSVIGDVAIQVGIASLTIGTTIEAIRTALMSFFGVGAIAAGAILIGTGIALKAGAAALGKAGSKAGVSTPGGASHSAASSTSTTPSSLQGSGSGTQLVATVRGQDLRFVLQAANDSYGALS